MRKPKTVKTKRTANDVELNRWCIEMAMKWPTHTSGGYHSGSGQGVYTQNGGYIPPVHKDEDVLGRAKAIRDWVHAVF